MDDVWEIAGISVPFAAGVAAGVSLRPPPSAALVLASVLIMTALWRRNRSGLLLYPLLFLSAGIFCGALSCLPAAGKQWHLQTAQSACTYLKGVIDRVPFRNEETGALLKALMTGDRSSLSRETVLVFRSSGASHILALSGLHLGFIYLFISKAFSFLGNSPVSRRTRCFCIIAAAGFYTLMTGAGPSIVRAFLFITIREISKIASGRAQEPGRTLLLCLTVQLALDPAVIVSVGFQLSYLAMCGIIFLLPHLQSWYPEGVRWDPMRYIWNAAALAISCQAFTAPLSWIKFHTFPKYFLLTNILALPLVSALMMLAMTVVVLSVPDICPHFLVSALEHCTSILLWLLGTISSM